MSNLCEMYIKHKRQFLTILLLIVIKVIYLTSSESYVHAILSTIYICHVSRCSSGYYGSTCEMDGEVIGVSVGASLAAALVIAITLAALLSWR